MYLLPVPGVLGMFRAIQETISDGLLAIPFSSLYNVKSARERTTTLVNLVGGMSLKHAKTPGNNVRSSGVFYFYLTSKNKNNR